MGNDTSTPHKQKASPSRNLPQQDLQNQPQLQERLKDVGDIVLASINDRIKNQVQISRYRQLYETCTNSPRYNRALGCLFGALIGDALGAYCEFHNKFTPEVVEKTMKMPGGGTFSLIAGQFTDDSELASHLLKGLMTIDPKQPLKEQHYTVVKAIANEYIGWLQSKPFDVGITTRKGIQKVKEHQKQYEGKSQSELKPIFEQIFHEVGTQNKESQSNGSLMRIAPMAVLFAASGGRPSAHQKFIKDEISLMHGKQVIKQAGYLWVNMLVKVITRAGDNSQQFQHILNDIEKLDKEKTMADWLEVGKQKHRIPGNTNIGWAKIAWTYGVHELHKLSSKTPQLDTQYFKTVMKEIIGKGGDTDTNAAIVGGLLGSLVGFTALPAEYINKMMRLTFPQQQTSINSHRRPHNYEPFWVLVSSLEFIDKYRECQALRSP